MSNTFGYKNEEGIKGFTLNVSFSQYANDYSEILIRNEKGEESKLTSNKETIEYASVLQGVYTFDNNDLTFGYFTTLGPHYYKQRGLEFGYRYSFFNQSSVLGLKYILMDQFAPSTYFTDVDFQSKKRPQQVRASEATISVEQVFSSFAKGILEFSTGKRNLERPRNYGIKLGSAFSITETLFSQIHTQLKKEDSARNLLNERGHFSWGSADLMLTYELAYDLLLSAGYSLGVEREEDKRTSIKKQVAQDQYSLGAKYTTSEDIEVRLTSLLSVTNVNSQEFSTSGGVTWNF